MEKEIVRFECTYVDSRGPSRIWCYGFKGPVTKEGLVLSKTEQEEIIEDVYRFVSGQATHESTGVSDVVLFLNGKGRQTAVKHDGARWRHFRPGQNGYSTGRAVPKKTAEDIPELFENFYLNWRLRASKV